MTEMWIDYALMGYFVLVFISMAGLIFVFIKEQRQRHGPFWVAILACSLCMMLCVVGLANIIEAIYIQTH